MSAHQEIVKQIDLMTPGTIFFPAAFRMLGTDDAIKMALSRLAKDKTILRLANGIYAVPQQHSLIGPITPSLEQIAAAIAERDQVQIKPAGVYALNKLGISQQVPTKHVYITNGQPRIYKIGANEILFKSASPKKLALKGPISSLLILAMDELGPSQLDDVIRHQLHDLIQKEDPELLANDLKLAPSRIARQLFYLLFKSPTHELVRISDRRSQAPGTASKYGKRDQRKGA
jgi:hypothetical protein